MIIKILLLIMNNNNKRNIIIIVAHDDRKLRIPLVGYIISDGL